MKTALFVMCLSGCAQAAWAAPITIQCPQTISVQQTTDARNDEWEPIADEGLTAPSLISIAVYVGHPGEAGTLVPDQTINSTAGETTIWHLAPDSRPYWVACIYTNSRLLLGKRIPDSAGQCYLKEALRGKKKNGVISFECE